MPKKGLGNHPGYVYLMCAHKHTRRVNGLAALLPAPGPAQEEVLAGLGQFTSGAGGPCGGQAGAGGGGSSGFGLAVRAGGGHPREPRGGATFWCDPGANAWGELVGYLVRGSGGAVYRVESRGSWRCSCPDHHGRHRLLQDSSQACKHALAVWALWRAAVGASEATPTVAAAVEASRRRERAAA